MLLRGMRLVPGAAPAGRAFVKLPPAYTVFPTTSWVHTMPESICTVGSGSAVTVELFRCSIGAGPFSAAVAGLAPPTSTPTATTTPAVTMARPLRCQVASRMMPLLVLVGGVQVAEPWKTTTGAPAA